MNINHISEDDSDGIRRLISRAEFRSKSEAILSQMTHSDLAQPEASPPSTLKSIAHELQVHQIELEMQSDELSRLYSELNRSNSRSNNFHDAEQHGILTVDTMGLIGYANITCSSMLGLARSDVLNTPFTSYILREDQDIYYFMRLQMLKKFSNCTCNLRLVSTDGRTTRFHVSGKAELDGLYNSQYNLVLTYAEAGLDTDDQAEIISSEEKFPSLQQHSSTANFNFSALDFIPSHVAILSRNGDIVAVNASWKRNGARNGASEAVVAGVGLNYLRSFPIDDYLTPDMATMKEGIKRVLDGSQLIFKYDYDVEIQSDIKRYRLQVSSMQSPAFLAVLLHDDISELHNALLFEAEQQNILKNAIASYKSELENERLKSSSATLIKGTLLETVSHEIRTPLNSVLGLANLLAESPSEHQQKAYVNKIKTAGLALRHLVDDVLDFSKIEAGQLTLVSAPFSIEELLRSVVASLVGMIEARPIEILIDIASDIPDVFVGDRFRLQQVLLNLCGNAAKFTSSGVITIGLRKQHTDEAQATCRFWVQDTGTGIAPEFMGKLFDIYAQEISISPCPQGGSGLGLSICSRLVQLMGGSMDVQSNRGLGSEFGFTIPLQTDCVPLSSQLPAHLKDLRVLVISDHDRLLSNVQRTCVGFSWQVDALDATAATTALHQPATQANTPYDLIMLDWRAEDSGVAEFLRGLPGSSWAATGHFLFLSSIGDMDLAQLAMNTLRFSNLVTRPITPFSLLKDVSILLQADRPVAVVTSFAPRQQLLGMRFLVADDNLLNQEILELILCKAGAEVVLVSDGAQAVAQLRASGQAFDAVLMDLQMPVLDGYAATQVIRKELGLVDLPIIAVTGLARPESHQKSEQAGLSGHLVKPLNVQKLLDILARVCNKPISPSVAQAEAPLPAQLPAISLSGLDIPSAMESFAGDLPLYLRLLERFLAAHSDDAAGASKLVECGNIKGAFDLLHTLQGTANMLRATDLIQLTAAAELALMDEHSEEVPALLQGIAQAMAVVAESVDQLRVVCTQQGNT